MCGEAGRADVTGAGSIAAAAASTPVVARLSAGAFGAGTYLPGRRVTGVETDEEVVRVHVVGVYGYTISEIAAGVREAVTPVAGGRRIDVAIEDLA